MIETKKVIKMMQEQQNSELEKKIQDTKKEAKKQIEDLRVRAAGSMHAGIVGVGISTYVDITLIPNLVDAISRGDYKYVAFMGGLGLAINAVSALYAYAGIYAWKHLRKDAEKIRETAREKIKEYKQA